MLIDRIWWGQWVKYLAQGQYNQSFFFLNAKLSLRDNGLIVFVNFSFSSGCDLHDRRQNYEKKSSDCISVWRVTPITDDGYKIIEMARTLS